MRKKEWWESIATKGLPQVIKLAKSNGVITSSNITKVDAQLKLVGKAFNEKTPKLIAGETFVCARFGNDWHGMKITAPK